MTPEEREKLTHPDLKNLDIADQLDLVRTSHRLDLHREIAGNVALHLARLVEDLHVAQSGAMHEGLRAAELEAKLKAEQERIEELERALRDINPGISPAHWLTLAPGGKVAAAAAHLKTMRQSAQALNGQVTMALQERDAARKEAHDDREQKREILHKLRLTEDELKKREIREEDAVKKLSKAFQEIEGLHEKVEALESACAASTKAHDEIANRLSTAHKDAADWEASSRHQFSRAEEATKLLQEIREECGTLRAQLAEATSDAQRWQEQAKNVGRACNANCETRVARVKRNKARRISALKGRIVKLRRALRELASVVEILSL